MGRYVPEPSQTIDIVGPVTDTHAPVGPPDSQQARIAILQAADALIVEAGYGALTMEKIAERAGTAPQMIHQWWSTKAEVLFAAAISGAAYELLPEPRATTIDDLAAYMEAVVGFLTTSSAGVGYRALLAEAQHDAAVAQLMVSVAVFDDAAHTILNRAIDRGDLPATIPLAAASALITGPAYYRAIEPGLAGQVDAPALAVAAVTAIQQLCGHQI